MRKFKEQDIVVATKAPELGLGFVLEVLPDSMLGILWATNPANGEAVAHHEDSLELAVIHPIGAFNNEQGFHYQKQLVQELRDREAQLQTELQEARECLNRALASQQADRDDELVRISNENLMLDGEPFIAFPETPMACLALCLTLRHLLEKADAYLLDSYGYGPKEKTDAH